MSPQIDRLGKAYEGRVHVQKLNADEQPDLVRELRVFGIPTVIVYQDGRAVTRKTGSLSALALEAIFSAAEQGEAIPIHGLSAGDRVLRGLTGLALGAIGWSAGPVWILVGIAGVVLFSAVYDRCPAWRAITRWAKSSKNGVL
jgi:thioredoxin 1